MKLKSLEIKGFKSFADKTTVLLDHPITGIVGPNGCGKSNIVDAIRWVIGEHKIKALRSDNLEDLIFNGSRTRNASGMAEVSLTFENNRQLLPTEFTTVTITRKFYKNGESEYRLNDVACRLKDIHNLFLDTGVSNDSYAIIELGMVDDIIKDKDNARRRMLEQAAGISIYKTRKKEAKSKLDATEQDLARIEDLLFEISNNLRTLESQAKKAERYYSIKKEYKDISIELAKASLEAFNIQYKQLQSQLDDEVNKKAVVENGLLELEEEVKKDKESLLLKEQALNGLQKQFNDLVNDLRQKETDKKLAVQKKEHLTEQVKNTERFLSTAGDQLKELEFAVKDGEERIAIESSKLESLKAQLTNQATELNVLKEDFQVKKQELDKERSQLQQVQRQQFELEKTLAVSESALQNAQRSQQQLQEEEKQRAAQIQQLATQKTQIQEQLVNRQEALKSLTEQQEQTKKSILEQQSSIESIRAQLIVENRQLDAKQNEYNLLKSLVDSLEGYPESIKFLSKHLQWSQYKAPLLSDILVVDAEYRVPIEVALQEYLNYFIVKNTTEAIEAINLLAQNKKGKAHFIVLDKVPAQVLEAKQYDGLVPALAHVKVDDELKPLASQLLSNIYIAEEAALSNQLPSDVTIVTKDGKIIAKHHSLSGGFVGAFEGNKLGRAKNLERLNKEIENLKSKSSDLTEQLKNAQQGLSQLNASLNDRAIEQAKQDVFKFQNQIVQIDHKVDNLEQLAKQASSRMETLAKQYADTLAVVDKAKGDIANVNAQFNDLKTEIDKLEQAYREAELKFNQANAAFNEQNLNLTRQQSIVENLQKEWQFRKNRIQEIQNQILNSEAQFNDTNQQMQALAKTLEELEKALINLLQKKEQEEQTLNEADRSYYEIRNQLSAKESALNQRRRERENVDTIIQSIRDKINDMKLKLAGIKERLYVEFKVDLDAILDEPRTTEESVTYLQEETDRLKKRLENIGEVNPTAIEAYTEMKSRYDFIVEQKQDLVNAKDGLLATILEVENTANAKFRETFEMVRANFVKVFKALFTEDDNADLRLTDEINVADSNIEIYAQPKGKRPSTLTQLSGGEKTLTSTAFLFAIYLIKPAPFCILDEVDAPLDDANVGKFTNMIRKFSNNSQFIIVTHNKQTMAAVDVIYGVTMQEPGVSRLVPVDFRSLN